MTSVSKGCVLVLVVLLQACMGDGSVTENLTPEEEFTLHRDSMLVRLASLAGSTVPVEGRFSRHDPCTVSAEPSDASAFALHVSLDAVIWQPSDAPEFPTGSAVDLVKTDYASMYDSHVGFAGLNSITKPGNAPSITCGGDPVEELFQVSFISLAELEALEITEEEAREEVEAQYFGEPMKANDSVCRWYTAGGDP